MVQFIFALALFAQPLVAEERLALSAFLCESQIQTASPQSLIEYGLSEGNLLHPQDLDILLGQLRDGAQNLRLPDSSSGIRTTTFRRALIAMLNAHSDRDELIQWISQRLSNMARNEKSRSVVESEVAAFQIKRPPMDFVRVKKGNYLVPAKLLFLRDPKDLGVIPPQTLVQVSLPYDFEVQSTLVTQLMWASVMNDVPEKTRIDSERYSNARTEIYAVGGELRDLAPDYPVTEVTFASLAEYANRLSRESGLTPAYQDLVVIGDASKGTAQLKGVTMESHLRHVEGFRLMSLVEWVILLTKAHQRLNQLTESGQRRALNRWGWFEGNASKTLHPVAQKRPLVIEGQPIYDLLGLVEDRVQDLQFDDLELVPDKTFFKSRGFNHYLAGGSIENPGLFEDPNDRGWIRADSLRFIFADDPHNFIGFRLARTITVPQKTARRKTR